MPASMEALMRASAPAWSTVPMARKRPVPPWKVMVPKQSVETRRPVSPRVLYCMGNVLCAERIGGWDLDGVKRMPDSGGEAAMRKTAPIFGELRFFVSEFSVTFG